MAIPPCPEPPPPLRVRGLIALLQTEDPDLLVLLAADEEGNSFSPLGSYALAVGVPQERRYGIAYDIEEPTAERPADALTLYPS